MLRQAWLFGAFLLICGCGGAAHDRYFAKDRQANGLVIILPGIEGESSLNHDIRQDLLQAGVKAAMPIYHWGRPVPLAGLLLNQVDFIGNRIEASKISDMIKRYQDEHPGRPVHLVGHSGSGGMAVFAAEGLPDGRKVDGIILLSASIASSYDLTKALQHSRHGIVNFYNTSDVALLGLGTTIVGNVDGWRGPSAGLIGFDTPSPSSHEDKQQAYARLYQVRVQSYMTGEGSAHAGSTGISFVWLYVSPWISAGSWPASEQQASVGSSRE